MEGSYTPPPPPPPPSFGAPAGGGGDLVHPKNPPVDPVLVLVLNLLVLGGVGYIIMGQKTKGIVTIVAWLVLVPVTCFFGSGVVALVSAIDGYMQAQHLRAGMPVGQWTFFNDHR
jgi:TM2 domain-containing membrane protein YozV